MPMKNIASLLLVTKAGHEQAAALAVEIQDWLADRHVWAKMLTHPAAKPECGAILCEAVQGVDAVVALGGDGTFIGVARHLIGQSVPFLGINFGRLGFLTETLAKDWQIVLRQMLAGKLIQQARTALSWSLERDGAVLLCGNAINDVVVSRGNLARVANIHVSVGLKPPAMRGELCPACDCSGGELGWIRADGIIVASPLGSSAYSLSARGPLVHPDLSSLLVTAIAPFLSSVPPLVLPGGSCVRLQCDAANGEDTGVCLTIDGQEGLSLRGGDIVSVCGVPGGLQVLTRNPDNYVQTLRRRGFIREFTSQVEMGATARRGRKRQPKKTAEPVQAAGAAQGTEGTK